MDEAMTKEHILVLPYLLIFLHNNFTLAHLQDILYNRQLTCVNTFVIHCQATCFQVIPDAQASLASLEHVLY